MSDLNLRIRGPVGRITLTRPQALNALTHPMIGAIETALDAWRDDPAVAMVVIDAAGDRAFCSGGDIEAIYQAMRGGDFAVPRRFWREEYRLNAKLHDFPKPVASFMQGFTMGGGVGVGCHASHRVVGDSSRIAMPECSIGLVPDVGGTLLLAQAPGRLGEYLGLTGARMGPGDAIHAGFADFYLPEPEWPGLIAALERDGDWQAIDRAARPAPMATMELNHDLYGCFSAATVAEIGERLAGWSGVTAEAAQQALARNCPLSMGCALQMVRDARDNPDIRFALKQEYRFTHRAAAGPDFPEGIRAQIIDKDRKPQWTAPAGPADIAAMLAPLGADELRL